MSQKVALSLLRNVSSSSSNVLLMPLKDLLVVFSVGLAVGIRDKVIPSQTEGVFYGRRFPPRTITVSKFGGQCNSQITVYLVTIKLEFGIAFIYFSRSTLSLGNRYTDILLTSLDILFFSL